MQVAVIIVDIDIGYVGYPYLIGMVWYHILYQVRILVKPMIRVCRVSRLGLRQHKAIFAEQMIETVSPWNPVTWEHILDHQPQLVSTDTKIKSAYLLDCINYLGFTSVPLLVICLALIVCLSGVAKQFASGAD